MTGKVRNHPSFPDGQFVTTSRVAKILTDGANMYIQTLKGSEYRLQGSSSLWSTPAALARFCGLEVEAKSVVGAAPMNCSLFE